MSATGWIIVLKILGKLGKGPSPEVSSLTGSKKLREVVLSGGEFAEIHQVLVSHWIRAKDDNGLHQMIKLISEVVKVDDNLLTVEDVLRLPLQDYQKLATQIYETMAK